MSRAAVLGAVLLGSVSSAQDYLSYKMLSTAQSPFPVYVDSRSNRPAGLDSTLMQNAVERAWGTWNAVQCAYPKVRSLGPTGGTVPNPNQTYDDFSVTPVWMLVNDADATEVFGNTTLVAGITLPRAYAGVLQTCDIFFNGFNIAWSMDSATPTNSMDVETVMLHEAGHCLGLGHFGPPDSVMDQVVEFGLPVRALVASDVQALCTRYPLAGESASPCFADGGCGQVDLKCITQPVTNGQTLKLCTRGCGLGTNAVCDVPLSCQASTAFSGFSGACLLPGSIVTQVGRPCVDNTQCGNSFGYCQRPQMASGTNQFWVDGYCTQACEVGQPQCPAGATCARLDVGLRCLQNCRVGQADCRPNYACAQIDSIGTTGVCIPRCYSDQDCASPGTYACRTCDGLCVARQSLNGQIGDVCLDDSTCGAGQVCRVTDPQKSQKQCTQQCSRGCATCPTGSTCTPGFRGELFCLRDCTGPGTCPLGLRCADTAVGKSCVPACSSGTDCPVGQECFMGECIAPSEDAGCGTLCTRPDAGKPVVIVPKDGGSGIGGTGGCGCTSVDPAFGFVLLGALGILTRRRSWSQP